MGESPDTSDAVAASAAAAAARRGGRRSLSLSSSPRKSSKSPLVRFEPEEGEVCVCVWTFRSMTVCFVAREYLRMVCFLTGCRVITVGVRQERPQTAPGRQTRQHHQQYRRGHWAGCRGGDNYSTSYIYILTRDVCPLSRACLTICLFLKQIDLSAAELLAAESDSDSTPPMQQLPKDGDEEEEDSDDVIPCGQHCLLTVSFHLRTKCSLFGKV